LSGRGLCDELITRPEESYRLCCVVVCDLETSRMGAPYIYIYDISSLWVKGLNHININLNVKEMSHYNIKILEDSLSPITIYRYKYMSDTVLL